MIHLQKVPASTIQPKVRAAQGLEMIFSISGHATIPLPSSAQRRGDGSAKFLMPYSIPLDGAHLHCFPHSLCNHEVSSCSSSEPRSLLNAEMLSPWCQLASTDIVLFRAVITDSRSNYSCTTSSTLIKTRRLRSYVSLYLYFTNVLIAVMM